MGLMTLLESGQTQLLALLAAGGEAPSPDDPGLFGWYFTIWSIIEDFEFFRQSKRADNIPILILLGMLAFYFWLSFKQAFRNDRIITRLEKNPELAKVHHRKWEPYHRSWPKKLHVWPYLLRIEFAGALFTFAFLMVWSILIQAPLEEPSNPAFTPNPSKAPWYFLGLQELLVYFDPWIAGVILPGVIVVGLMAIPYIDPNPYGNGYYTWKQRKFSITTFLIGFVVIWVGTVFLGTYMRGPGWFIFWPWQRWDPHLVEHALNKDLNQFFGIDNAPPYWVSGSTFWESIQLNVFHPATIFGLIAFAVIFGLMVVGSWWFMWKFKHDRHIRMSFLQKMVLHNLHAGMWFVILKMILRLFFTVKYITVVPGVANI